VRKYVLFNSLEAMTYLILENYLLQNKLKKRNIEIRIWGRIPVTADSFI